MDRGLIAIGIAQNASGSTTALQTAIENGTVIAGRAMADENGVNINTYYAKIADVPSISTDIYPYTDAEIDTILGIS